MAGLDELFNEIPTQEIASKLGADEGEVNSAIQTLVPRLVGGLQQNVRTDDTHPSNSRTRRARRPPAGCSTAESASIRSTRTTAIKIVSNIFGGNDSNQVASALAGGGAGSGDLLKKLLPILAPIVLAYIGKQLSEGGGAAAPAGTQAQASVGGGLGDILGSILGGGGRRWRRQQPARQHPRQRARAAAREAAGSATSSAACWAERSNPAAQRSDGRIAHRGAPGVARLRGLSRCGHRSS